MFTSLWLLYETIVIIVLSHKLVAHFFSFALFSLIQYFFFLEFDQIWHIPIGGCFLSKILSHLIDSFPSFPGAFPSSCSSRYLSSSRSGCLPELLLFYFSPEKRFLTNLIIKWVWYKCQIWLCQKSEISEMRLSRL